LASSHLEIAAFDEISAGYDAAEARNPILQWMRDRVQRAALSVFPRPGRLLEIGCGTGVDALFLAQCGHLVVAMEPSRQMLGVAKDKIAAAGFSDRVHFRQGGVASLDEVIASDSPASFDGIFSNFGALNCVADLQRFARDAAILLRPGGRMLLSLMPPICPWEIIYYLLKGKPAAAFRRWRGRTGTGGIAVRVGKQWVQTYYHFAAAIRAAGAHDFDLEKQFALGLLVPPPYLQSAAPSKKIFNSFVRWEELSAGWPLLRNGGDHLVLILRKRDA